MDKRFDAFNGSCGKAANISHFFKAKTHDMIKKALPLHTGEAGFSDSYYSHSTNSRIWKFIYHNFASKSFANMLIFHLLFLVARFLSIKIVS